MMGVEIMMVGVVDDVIFSYLLSEGPATKY